MMQTEERKKAVIYCRVSTKEQVDEGNSLTTQERICRDYALKNGYDVAEIFIEQGESAKTAQRTELQRLLAYCAVRKNGIHAVIAYKIDRISRNTDDYSQIRILLKRYGVEIRSTSEYFENTPTGRFMENIIANVAQFDNDVRTERSVGGMRDATREGRYVWMAPVGYKNLKIAGKSNIAPDDMADLVREAFEEVAKNMKPVEEVRRQMEKKGLITRRGKLISRSYFYYMLRNKLYVGEINVLGEKHKGIFKPLVSVELFEQVQRVLRHRARRTTQYEVRNPDFPLRRFIWHPEGSKLTGCWCKGRSKRYAFYRYHSPKMLFRKELFEESFMNFMDRHELDEEYIETFKSLIKPAFIKAIKAKENSGFQYEKTIAALKEKQSVLVQKNLDGYISNEVLQNQLEVVDIALRDAYSSIMNNPGTTYSIETMQSLLKFIEDFLRKPSNVWKQANFQLKIQLQWFAFPKGLLFDGSNWQTTETCFLFKLKELITPYLSYQVHSIVILPNASGCTNNNKASSKEISPVEGGSGLGAFFDVQKNFEAFAECLNDVDKLLHPPKDLNELAHFL